MWVPEGVGTDPQKEKKFKAGQDPLGRCILPGCGLRGGGEGRFREGSAWVEAGDLLSVGLEGRADGWE